MQPIFFFEKEPAFSYFNIHIFTKHFFPALVFLTCKGSLPFPDPTCTQCPVKRSEGGRRDVSATITQLLLPLRGPRAERVPNGAHLFSIIFFA